MPSYIDATDKSPAVRIIVHQTAIPVDYDEVRNLIPKLLAEHAVDMVLHIGMASGNSHYEIEESAHRDDYSQHKDVNDHTLPRDGTKQFPDCPRNIRPTLAYEKLWHEWFDMLDDLELTRKDLRRSDDAGHYLCDYIYLNSLVWYGRKNGMEGGSLLDRPVMFLHTPPDSDAKSLDRGVHVAEALLKAMAAQVVT